MTRSMSVRGWLALAAGSVALAVSAGAAQAQAPMVLKIATVNAGDNPRNISANEFAQRRRAKLRSGKIKGEVYINNQLARGEGAMLEGVQLGTIDIAPVGSAPIGGIFEPALPAARPALPLVEPRAGLEGHGRPARRRSCSKKMEAKGLKGLLLRRRLGLPQHACPTSARS